MSRIHKQKSKLIKLKNDKNKNTYITTKEDCIKWSRIINREIFNNQLADMIMPPPPLIGAYNCMKAFVDCGINKPER